jgi:hypothetical protein
MVCRRDKGNKQERRVDKALYLLTESSSIMQLFASAFTIMQILVVEKLSTPILGETCLLVHFKTNALVKRATKANNMNGHRANELILQ